MMSFQTLFAPECARDLNARIGFRFGNVSYVVTVADEAIAIERREPEQVDVTFSGTPTNMDADQLAGAMVDQLAMLFDMP